jgi:hypothetical protein
LAFVLEGEDCREKNGDEGSLKVLVLSITNDEAGRLDKAMKWHKDVSDQT